MDALDRKAWLGMVQLAVVIGVTLFGPAWSTAWWQAWLVLATFVGCASVVTVWLMKHDRGLLAKRVEAGAQVETRGVQKVIQSIASIAFLGVFVVSALDHRFDWSPWMQPFAVPLTIVGELAIAFGFYFVFLVFRANTFTSAAIEVASEQHVVSTGPYAYVRHPMYLGALVMLAGIPLALGSFWGLFAVGALKLVIVWRLLDEEKFLAKTLAGYEAYRANVRYRLVPHVW